MTEIKDIHQTLIEISGNDEAEVTMLMDHGELCLDLITYTYTSEEEAVKMGVRCTLEDESILNAIYSMEKAISDLAIHGKKYVNTIQNHIN